ncbi:MAG: DUF5060 domain-containing protein [Verrucomicrobiota bacterium]
MAETGPLVDENLVFEEVDGVVAVEAEHFFKQEEDAVRAWYLTTSTSAPGPKPDADPNHAAGASGGAYLEILPDTRKNHGETLIRGENFQPDPGKMAILSYKVFINDPGRYYVWVRTHSTGTEDNGIHVGLNGTWPESGARMQWTAKRQWFWDSKQRTNAQHGGVLGQIWLDIEKVGEHVIQFSMREDGFEFDKFLLTKTAPPASRPEGLGPKPKVKSGTLPKAFPVAKGSEEKKFPAHWGSPPDIQTRDYVPLPGGYGHGSSTLKHWIQGNLAKDAKKRKSQASLYLPASGFSYAGSNFYLDKGKWLAINPEQHQAAEANMALALPTGKYNLTLHSVGENDGSSTYTVVVNGNEIGRHTCPLANDTFEEGPKFQKTWNGLEIAKGDSLTVKAEVASKDGAEWSRARWAGLRFAAADEATRRATAKFSVNAPASTVTKSPTAKPRTREPALHGPRSEDGDGSVTVSGELRQWHKVTLDLNGPFAHELDRNPNPFTDYQFTVTFAHESGSPTYVVPGYFAADGNAAQSSAEAGSVWRAHLSPDKPGVWNYKTQLRRGTNVALGGEASKMVGTGEQEGNFKVEASDKTGRDFRAHGRLTYVGKGHLQFAGSKEYFVKAGADAPETFLAYADFDNTEARKPGKSKLKTWEPHVRDWKEGDPTWKDGKGKGMIGALNYLSGKGANVFSFLPYNAGGDGDNVWPFANYGEKFHYDCSKLDQWGIVFDHATAKGLYLHFKLQETEMDDNRRGGHKDRGNAVIIPAALDGGDLGPERKLYCREILARFGHALALNWNLGEENTQTTQQQVDMMDFIRAIDPYDHHVVLHTFPNDHDRVYGALLGNKALTGLSVQNSNVKDCHHQVVKWTAASRKAGHPWVVAFDEPGDAQLGMPPDPDWPGMPEDYSGPTVDDVRKYTLWGTLMAGGGGVEYYFGYKLPENDLVCEDWRSRDLSWDYCRYAIQFFDESGVAFWNMKNRNGLVGNPKNQNSNYCLAKKGAYVVFMTAGGEAEFATLPEDKVDSIRWFNPRTGEWSETEEFPGTRLRAPDENDWAAVIE